ncbi:glycosyltransferase family 92 protein RCOM_0530710-like [Silene latifolia]|uniref:glycosyltransferase family 92 protein RCOM_0530710-like n=1 Tax=Silene latifolia TaxID=37657 RepID=UPI003D77154E
MDSRTIKRCARILHSRKFILLCFFFILSIFLVLFPILKFENTKPIFLTSNVIEIPRIPVSATSISVKKNISHKNPKIELIIEDSVLFQDFILVILAVNSKVSGFRNFVGDRIHCFYQKETNESGRISYPILSIDEYDPGGSRWTVRCPSPPQTRLMSIGRVESDNVAGVNWVAKITENQTAISWGKMLAYEVTFDGEETIAIFVKGLGLNGERKSDPSQFTCRFGNDFELFTKAITAAQEVIRCPLPRGVTKSSISKNNEEIRVTVERTVNSKVHGRNYVVPSIAKLHKNSGNSHLRRNYKHDLCACTMVWNQAAFIREWIVYHAWLGIGQWFVYDNNSDDELNEVINDLNSENYNVSRHVWPWIKSQEAGFAHCLLRARDQCNWVAFFDVDEFYYLLTPKLKNNIVPGRGRNSLRDMVNNVTLRSPSKGQIKTNCYNFGPSGLKKSPIEGVAVGYTCRVKANDRHKSIVRPDAVDESLLNRVHHFELKTGFTSRNMPLRRAVVNHYKYQVWDVFKTKFVRRVSAYVPDWQEKNSEKSKDRTPGLGTQAIEPQNWHLKFCDVWDTKLRDFIRANLAFNNSTLLPWYRSA